MGRSEEAIQAFDKAIEIDPQFAMAWNNKGDALNSLAGKKKQLCVIRRLQNWGHNED